MYNASIKIFYGVLFYRVFYAICVVKKKNKKKSMQ